MMLEDKVDDLFGYVEERCLWQFSSRTWDRQENIDGVIDQVAALLANSDPILNTPMNKLHYADAKIMVNDLRERFQWIRSVDKMESRVLLDGLKARLVDTAITRSSNRELNHHLY
jgi:V-containing nitrogenase delta subunit